MKEKSKLNIWFSEISGSLLKVEIFISFFEIGDFICNPVNAAGLREGPV